MKILENLQYCKEIKENSKINIQWDSLKNKTVMISGATGLIGSYMIDLIMYNNLHNNLNCKIVALGRNKNSAKERFEKYNNSELFEFLEFDLNVLQSLVLHQCRSHLLLYLNILLLLLIIRLCVFPCLYLYICFKKMVC